MTGFRTCSNMFEHVRACSSMFKHVQKLYFSTTGAQGPLFPYTFRPQGPRGPCFLFSVFARPPTPSDPLGPPLTETSIRNRPNKPHIKIYKEGFLPAGPPLASRRGRSRDRRPLCPMWDGHEE